MVQGITLENKKNIKVHASTIKLSCLIVFMSLLCLFSVLFITRADAAIMDTNTMYYVPDIDDFFNGRDDYCTYTLAYVYQFKVVIAQGVIYPTYYPDRSNELFVKMKPFGMSASGNPGMLDIRIESRGTLPENVDLSYWQRTIVYDAAIMREESLGFNGEWMENLYPANAPLSWTESSYALQGGVATAYSIPLDNPFGWWQTPAEIASGRPSNSNWPSHNLFLSKTHNIIIDIPGGTNLNTTTKMGTVMYTNDFYKFIDFWYTRHSYNNNKEQTTYLQGILDALNQANADNDYDGTVAQSQLDKAAALKSEQQAQDDFVNDNKQALDDIDITPDTTGLTNYFDWLNNRFFITLLISSLSIAIVFFSLFGGR